MAYTDMSAAFTYKKPLLWKDLDALAENDAYLKLNGWADSTKAVFYQAAAPTGWTKDGTYNDRILRVVGSGNGGGTAAGTQGISSAITLAHTHVISSQANHVHSAAHTHNVGFSSHSAGSNPASIGESVKLEGSSVVRYAPGSSSMSGSLSSGATTSASPSVTSTGTHDHGGTTGSQLTTITLAYIDAINCSKDTSSGYTDKTTRFTHGDDLGAEDTFQDLDDMGGSDSYLQARLTPTGSVSLFYQAAAPTGWTKVTSQNDKAVRIVSGSGGGSGGSQAMSTTISLAHSAHSQTSQGAHTHSIGAHTHSLVAFDPGFGIDAAAENGGRYYVNGSGYIEEVTPGSSTNKNWLDGNTTSTTPGASASDSNHTHALASMLTDTTLAYIDVIQCSKDTTGAEPFAYQDLTSFWVDAHLLAYQDLNDMGKNDAHIKYRTIPAASACMFFQASSPLAWTRVTSQHDKGVRIVSGAGGVAGGTTVISGGITLAHTHAITAYDHTHTFAHTHTVSTTNSGIANTTNHGLASNTGFLFPYNWVSGGAASSVNSMIDTFVSDGVTDNDSHSHGGVTTSALSNVTLAYLDVLLCTKD